MIHDTMIVCPGLAPVFLELLICKQLHSCYCGYLSSPVSHFAQHVSNTQPFPHEEKSLLPTPDAMWHIHHKLHGPVTDPLPDTDRYNLHL